MVVFFQIAVHVFVRLNNVFEYTIVLLKRATRWTDGQMKFDAHLFVGSKGLLLGQTDKLGDSAAISDMF